MRLQKLKRGAHVPDNIVPISDWSTMFPRICVPCFLAGRQPWVAIFGIADTSAIPKIVSHGAVNPFPTNLCASKSSEQNNSYANGEVYCESLPTEEGDNHNEVCNVGWSECVRSGGGTLHCGYSPNSPKVSSACLMTPSGGNNGFHNETFGYCLTP